MAGHGRGLLLALSGLLLVLAGSAPDVRAGSRVVAWGAGSFVASPPDLNDYGQSIVPANLTNAVLVAGGWRHSVALKAGGTLQGWGYDYFGQIDFPTGSNYAAIACGDLFSLALNSDGTVTAVGDGFYGQTAVPANASNVVAVSCGFYHCLVLKTDGTVVAWGGQGDIDYGQGVVPTNGESNVVAVAAGGYHNLVLKSDGSLFAWGDNRDGETNIPAGLSNVVAIAAGGFHNLALGANGTVAAWGLDNFGQTDVPTDLSNVVAIAAGSFHNLALKSNGTVVAWGENTEGVTNVPANLTNVVQIAAGDFHSLALVRTNPPMRRTVVVQPNFETNGFRVTVPTQNGRVYQLQYKNSLTDDVWQSLSLYAGTGGNLQLTDPVVATQRCYRVEQW